MPKELTHIFTELKRFTGEDKVAIRVDCDNFETVYIHQIDDGRFLVSDGHYTFKYLGGKGLDYYLTIDQIGMSRIERLCSEHNVELITGQSDGDDDVSIPAIGIFANTDEEVQSGLRLVATCIDAIFSDAMDQKLQRELGNQTIPTKAAHSDT